MSCSNCYNGCTQIVSDQCIKYTGVDIPVLGIQKGDSLSYVEQALIGFLTSTLDGSGILITLDPSVYCEIVSKNLPTCSDVTAIDLFEALVKSVCELKTQLTATNTDLSNLRADVEDVDAPYTIPSCLTGLDSASTTHDVLQNMITSFCGFVASVGVTYVKIADINTYIAQYLQGQQTSEKYYTKMVPYVAMEFYPTSGILNNFDDDGIGIVGSAWEKIYLCNGLNGTPDKRGVVAVGVTDGTMKGGPMSSVVNPSSTPLNPTYIKGGTAGSNSIVLTQSQMPNHTHAPNISVVANPHSHELNTSGTSNTDPGNSVRRAQSPTGGDGYSSLTGTPGPAVQPVTVTLNVTSSIAPVGGDAPHSNVQPGIGCYYIMYIPS